MPESYGFLSTYPPTQCGLASFTASMVTALGAGRSPAEVGVVRVLEREDHASPPEVVHRVLSGVPGSQAAAAAALDRYSVAIVQHEYGIYGGPDGDSVIGILRRLRVPAIVVLHTVLVEPSPHQREVLEQVVAAASAVVVMTGTARRRLLDGYQVDPTKVTLIAHGAPTDWSQAGPSARTGPPLIVTWGLLGPGKGIEWAVEALARLQDLRPAPVYLVAGETHPNVVEHEGEAYREMIRRRADGLGLGAAVRFDNRYLGRDVLRELVRGADAVVLPYDSTDQVTSGVLTEAVTAGRPIVATAFPHAVELLSTGAGTIVAHRDPAAIAGALRRILVEPGVAESMRSAGRRLAPDLTWSAVADRYRELGVSLRQEVTSVVA